MIADLRPYPTGAESGTGWFGEVPAHWSISPNRALFTEVLERNHPDAEMLSVTIAHGITPQRALLQDVSRRDGSNLDKSAYKLVRPGDIVYNKMRAWQGAIGSSSHRGIVSPAYVVQRPRPGVISRYFHYLFRTPAFVAEAERWSYGITSDMWSLRPEHFRLISSCVPPMDEQLTIVRFLDHVDRRIRRYIRAKQKLIKLLEEQKQAIIHQAVTRGLDPSIRSKPSGWPWLGDVPEHWEVMPLRRASTIWCDGPFGSGLTSSHYTDHGVRVIRLQNVGHGEFRDASPAFISFEHYSALGDHDVHAGDLLVAGLGDERHPAGRACMAPAFITPAMVKADCFRFRLRPDCLDPEFAAAHLTATAAITSALLSTGATRQRVNLQSMASRAIAVPPLAEQRAIVERIMGATAPLSSAADVVKREVALARELHTYLIAAVATGKVDVRDAGKRLPNDLGELEPLANSESTYGADVETDDFLEDASSEVEA